MTVEEKCHYEIPIAYCKILPRIVRCTVCKTVFNLKKSQIHFHHGTMVEVLLNEKGDVVQ